MAILIENENHVNTLARLSCLPVASELCLHTFSWVPAAVFKVAAA